MYDFLYATGTPVQNDLQELWSLLELLHPSIFGTEGNENILSECLSRDRGAESELIGRMETILARSCCGGVKADVMLPSSAPRSRRWSSWKWRRTKRLMYKAAVEQYGAVLKQKQDSGTSTREREGAAGGEAKQEEGVLGETRVPWGASSGPSRLCRKADREHLHVSPAEQANHPLAGCATGTPNELVKQIAPVLRKAGASGYECTVARVEEELLGYSDFDLHQLCVAHCGHKPMLKDHVLPEEKFLGLRQVPGTENPARAPRRRAPCAHLQPVDVRPGHPGACAGYSWPRFRAPRWQVRAPPAL